jgi:hypothetical protein
MFEKLSPADQAIMAELLNLGGNSAGWKAKDGSSKNETATTLMASARRLQIYRLSGLYDAECQQRAEATIHHLLGQILDREPGHANALALLADLSPDTMQEAA